jgi:hypothetical protein
MFAEWKANLKLGFDECNYCCGEPNPISYRLQHSPTVATPTTVTFKCVTPVVWVGYYISDILCLINGDVISLCFSHRSGALRL